MWVEKATNLVNCNGSERARGRGVRCEILTDLDEFEVGVVAEESV